MTWPCIAVAAVALVGIGVVAGIVVAGIVIAVYDAVVRRIDDR